MFILERYPKSTNHWGRRIVTDRRDAMGLLAHADAVQIATAWSSFLDPPEYRILRGPETGLVMIRGRAGGGGEPFNLGEATVTRATVRLDSGEVGHSYCLGCDGDKAVHAALFDALWQRPETKSAVEDLLLEPLREAQVAADDQRRKETAATRVDFFTMVRGEDQ